MTSERAAQYRIAMCPHCGEELSVVTPAAEPAIDVERLARAFQAEIGGPVSAYARERAAELAAEYLRLATPTTPEPDQ